MAIIRSLKDLQKAINANPQNTMGGLADAFVPGEARKINDLLRRVGASIYIVASSRKMKGDKTTHQLAWRKQGYTYDSAFPNVTGVSEKWVREYLSREFGITITTLYNDPKTALSKALERRKRIEAKKKEQLRVLTEKQKRAAEREAKKLAKSAPKAPKAVKEKVAKAKTEAKAKAPAAVKKVSSKTSATKINEITAEAIKPIKKVATPKVVQKVKEEVKEILNDVKQGETTKTEAVQEIKQVIAAAPAAPAMSSDAMAFLQALKEIQKD